MRINLAVVTGEEKFMQFIEVIPACGCSSPLLHKLLNLFVPDVATKGLKSLL
jgi:hypothetical protein